MAWLEAVGQRYAGHVILFVRFIAAEGQRQVPVVEKHQINSLWSAAVTNSAGFGSVCIHRHIGNRSNQLVSFLKRQPTNYGGKFATTSTVSYILQDNPN